MTSSTFRFRAPIARRIIDPNFKKLHGMERHVFVVPVRDMPEGLPFEANARRPNPKKRIYRQVEKSLLNKLGEPDTFHLKNKGITIVARSVEEVGEGEYDVKLTKGTHGVLDGGHTYALIIKHKDSPNLPQNQYVQVEVRVGVPDDWIPEIAGGLNTSVQVEDMSLDNLAGKFKWLKNHLKGEPYYKEIAWSENDPGAFDARDILSLLYLFNVELHPNDDGETPIAAYEKKSVVLDAFEEDPKSFRRMLPIVKDILVLSDTIAKEARDIWNESNPGAKGGNLAFMDERNGKPFAFHFLQEHGPYCLYDGALYPLLGAFRWHVERDPKTKKMRWRKGFKTVLKAWRKNAPELLKLTKSTSDQLGRNPNAVGKSRPHWAALHTKVSFNDLLEEQQQQKAA